MKAQPNKDNPHKVGGCNIQVNPKTPYFIMGFVESAIGWKTRWFYAKDSPSGTDDPLVHLNHRVAQRASWRNVLTLEEREQTEDFVTRITELKDTGLTGVQLSGIFLKRRVQPLQARAEPMWEYKGAVDTSRVRPDELSGTELDTFMRLIIKSTAVDTSLAVQPFSTTNPPPAVSSSAFLLPYIYHFRVTKI